MESIINIHIAKLPEGVYLATSDDCSRAGSPGAYGDRGSEIARDVARKLIEARAQRSGAIKLTSLSDSFDYPLIVNA